MIDNTNSETLIVAVDNSKLIKEFINIPRLIYKNHDNWIPSLHYEDVRFLSNKNPYLKNNPYQMYIAKRGDEFIGRVSVSTCQSHNEHGNERVAFFGFFECINDDSVAKLLLDSVVDYARSVGMNKVRGPFNFTSNHTCGLLIQGQSTPPLIEMPYNPKYYRGLFESNGLYKCKDLLAYWVDLSKTINKESVFKKIEARFSGKSILIRNMNTKGTGFVRDIEMLYEVYHNAWKNNWGFIPLDKDEYLFIANRMRPLIDSDLALIAELDGAPVGFCLTLPDFNQVVKAIDGKLNLVNLIRILFLEKKINKGRMILAGVIDGFRNTPLSSVLMYKSLKSAAIKGYKGVEMSWVLDDNVAANRVLETLNASAYKQYRIFEKPI